MYDYAHIGNFRAYVSADILRRFLEYKGFEVFEAMNLTDVDDKTIKRSQELKLSLSEFTDRYAQEFFNDLATLNIKPANIYPRATAHIPEMISLVNTLMKKGFAYKGKDGSIYYNVAKFKKYGKLAHIKVGELKTGARVKQDNYTKEEAQDFALWKAWDKDDGEVFWDSEFGKGRPGWHLECSAMSMKYLGETFDIHAGGVDLVFPHHQNEIAQSEAATGKDFAHYWVHNGWLLVEGKKMSKSLKNFFTLRDIIAKGRKPSVVRYLLLSTHYRMPLNFTEDGLAAAESAVQRLTDFATKLKDLSERGPNACGDDAAKIVRECSKKFEKAMDNDLTISEALAALFEMVHLLNKEIGSGNLCKDHAIEALEALKKIDTVLGVLPIGEEIALEKEVESLIQQREEARKRKDFKASDSIRDELKKKGIILEDSANGVRWKRA